MVCLKDPLVQKICELYEKISNLENLNPSKDVDTLFTQLVRTCIPPHPIDVTKLCNQIQEMRAKLILLCGQAEGLLEKHYSTVLGKFERPIDNLEIFPYYSNYVKLSRLEFELLSNHCPKPTRVAFVGSGPLPLTSIVLALNHFKNTVFHNYDLDAPANAMASMLLKNHPDLSNRMSFHTSNVMDLSENTLKDYDVVFLAALVGMEIEDKMNVIEHLAKNMSPGAILMLRSAHGARAFLYPVVEPRHLNGFDVLSVFHPTDEVINSVIVARKSLQDHIHQGFGSTGVMLCSKCGELRVPFGSPKLVEELMAVDEHLC